MSIIKSFFLKHNQYCLYAYTLQNTYLKLWSLFSLGFDTDTLPLQIILKIRNLRRMTLPRSPALHKKQLDVQPTFGKSKILNMIMPCCIYEYLPFFSYYPSIRLSLSLHRMVRTQITKVYSLASSK